MVIFVDKQDGKKEEDENEVTNYVCFVVVVAGLSIRRFEGELQEGFMTGLNGLLHADKMIPDEKESTFLIWTPAFPG